MAEIVSLSKARKAKARVAAEAKASENRILFGRTKAEKTLDKARIDQAASRIDAHKRADEDKDI